MQNSFLKTINIIYMALLAGQLLFMAVAYFAGSQMERDPQDTTGDMFMFVIPVVVGTGLFVSNFLFKQMLSKIGKEASFESKLASYRTALIVRYALLEGPSLFSTVAFLLSGNLMFLAFSGVMILAFLMNRPTRDKIAQDLNLNGKETEMLG